MAFVLSKVVWLVCAPANLLALLVLAAFGLLIFRRRRSAAVLLGLVAAALLAIAVLPLGVWLLAPLEDRFPAHRIDGPLAGIVVLGGGVDNAVSAARGRIELNAAADRLLAAADLARARPDLPVVFTGGSGRLIGDEPGEAEIVAASLETLGLPPERMIFEGGSRTTAESAEAARAHLPPDLAAAAEPWLLVTSAWHMPRSIAAFRAAGWNVVAYPVDYRTRGGEVPSDPSFNILGGLVLLDMAVHEWVGLAGYRLLGVSDDLFPAPAAAAREN